jgi:chromosomal replication initiation ATPase DnaA
MTKVIPSKSLTLSIAAEVSRERGIGIKDILSRSRRRATVAARVEVIRRLYAAGNGLYSTTGIGKAVGLTHTTVIYWISEERYRSARMRAMRHRWEARHVGA